jgi:hypothetical protein
MSQPSRWVEPEGASVSATVRHSVRVKLASWPGNTAICFEDCEVEAGLEPGNLKAREQDD